MALRLNTSEKNEIMPRRKARAEKPRLAQMLLRSGSLAGVESSLILAALYDSIYESRGFLLSLAVAIHHYLSRVILLF